MKKQQGFTIIELAICLTFVLGLMAACGFCYMVYIGVQELFK